MGTIKSRYHVDCFLRLRNGLIIWVSHESHMLCSKHRGEWKGEPQAGIKSVPITHPTMNLLPKQHKRALKTLGKKTNSPALKWTKDVTRNLTAGAQTVNKHMKNTHPPHWSPRSCSLNNNDELLPQIQRQCWPWQLLARMGSCRKSTYSLWPRM